MGNRQAKHHRFLILGLRGAGKTSVIFNLRLGGVITTLSEGFSVETVEFKNYVFNIFDVGGSDLLRPRWQHYFAGTDALIFVVDSNDVEHLQAAGEELRKVLAEDEMCDAALLVFANKQDLPWSLSPEEVVEHMGLLKGKSIANRWGVQGSCAKTVDGIWEGLDWLANILAQKVPYDGPRINAGSLGVIEEPEYIVTSRQVVVFDEPGSCRRVGLLDADVSVNVVEVLRGRAMFSLTYGRIEEPVEGWLALHSGQVRANYFVVSLCCSLSEEGNMSVSCRNMAGEELAHIDLLPSELTKQRTADLRQNIAKQTKKDQTCLRLVTFDGSILRPEDDGKTLAASLTGAQEDNDISATSVFTQKMQPCIIF